MKIFTGKKLILLISLFLIIIYFTMNLFTKTSIVTSNPDLKIIKNGWIGNPVNEDGTFRNINHPHLNDFSKFLRWQLAKNPQKEEKNSEKFRLKVVDANEFLRSSDDGIVLVGHATFMIRLNGKLIITDPIFDVPSIVMKRFSKLPFDPNKIKNLDYILLSHDHYDHLHKESLELLYRNNPKVKLLTSLELGKYCTEFLEGITYQEAGWYQQYDITSSDIKITYLPTRHWGTRGIGAVNKRLWGAFMIQTGDLSIYFGGDSGWDNHFEEVYNLFGSPDYAIIGIGAYKPEWFMSASHTSPKDGLKAAEVMKAKNLIPMHYGTFDLSDEPIGDPHREVHRLFKENKYQFRLVTPNIGEVISL